MLILKILLNMWIFKNIYFALASQRSLNLLFGKHLVSPVNWSGLDDSLHVFLQGNCFIIWAKHGTVQFFKVVTCICTLAWFPSTGHVNPLLHCRSAGQTRCYRRTRIFSKLFSIMSLKVNTSQTVSKILITSAKSIYCITVLLCYVLCICQL